MATFPSIDLSAFDLRKLDLRSLDLAKLKADLAAIDLPSVDLADLNLPGIDLSSVDTTKLTNALRDAAYVTIGFGVLAVQQAQVRRRELVATLSTRFGTSKSQMDELLGTFEARLATLTERFEVLEAQIDAAVAKVEDRLPEQAGALLGQAHDIAKAARQQVRGLIRSAA